MRAKTLNIDGNKRECVLVCGGPSFKVYSSPGINGWIIVIKGKRPAVTNDERVSRYVTLRYQPLNQQEDIKRRFNEEIVKGIV